MAVTFLKSSSHPLLGEAKKLFKPTNSKKAIAAVAVMKRRNLTLSDQDERILEAVFEVVLPIEHLNKTTLKFTSKILSYLMDIPVERLDSPSNGIGINHPRWSVSCDLLEMRYIHLKINTIISV